MDCKIGPQWHDPNSRPKAAASDGLLPPHPSDSGFDKSEAPIRGQTDLKALIADAVNATR